MHVHLAREVEDSIFESFRALLPKSVSASHGNQPGAGTNVLVVGFPTPEMLAPLTELDTLIVPFAGLVPTARETLLARPDIRVFNLHHNAGATAEKALELLFAAAKGTTFQDRAMRESGWAPRFDSSNSVELAGKTAVVLGYGEIGQRIGNVLVALGMEVIAVRRSGSPTNVPSFKPESLRELAPTTDVLVVCAPLTPETEGLVNKDVISDLRERAIVVNVGRGAIIDEEALYNALKAGRLHGAGLDVWWQYPKPGESCDPSHFPFAELPNVVMSPHTGGTVIDTEPKRFTALADLLVRLKDGKDLPRQVDVAAGY